MPGFMSFHHRPQLASVGKSHQVGDPCMKDSTPSNLSASGCIERMANGMHGFVFLCVLACSASPALAFATDEEPVVQAVFVAGSKDPDWKSYKAFLAGINVFEEKVKMAPDASLRFVLRPRKANVSLNGVTMRIETNDGHAINVPVAPDGTFALPRSEAAAADGGEILLSKKRNTLSWRPAIHSRDVPPDARRLGDLRLECFVRWSIEQADLLAFFRATINAFGGPCTTSAIKVDYISERPLAAVYLEMGERRERLASKWIEENGHVYLPPVHDTSWSDDTLVRFEYSGVSGQ